jgi:hypothetical protein
LESLFGSGVTGGVVSVGRFEVDEAGAAEVLYVDCGSVAVPVVGCGFDRRGSGVGCRVVFAGGAANVWGGALVVTGGALAAQFAHGGGCVDS